MLFSFHDIHHYVNKMQKLKRYIAPKGLSDCMLAGATANSYHFQVKNLYNS